MAGLLSPDQLLTVLEGNRRLTLRTIEAFPAEQLFGYTPGAPLRSFGEMAVEILSVEEAYLRGIVTGEWQIDFPKPFATKEELLSALEAVRAQTLAWWPQVTEERLLTVEADQLFGGPEQSHFDRLLYALENEIHHRGQGMVYLRLLGVEPPRFWERD